MVQTPDGVSVRAVIEKICGEGSNRYAVTRPKSYDLLPQMPKNETVTFSLEGDVWKGKKEPEKGQVVFLENIQEYSKGWRAFSVRPSQ